MAVLLETWPVFIWTSIGLNKGSFLYQSCFELWVMSNWRKLRFQGPLSSWKRGWTDANRAQRSCGKNSLCQNFSFFHPHHTCSSFISCLLFYCHSFRTNAFKSIIGRKFCSMQKFSPNIMEYIGPFLLKLYCMLSSKSLAFSFLFWYLFLSC